ncbi:uncharacterized protein LOC117114917 [Anneissia japonica]|uniref:uncharacterized protein LOC117114917 n=1 Tax=Anneissia japonica TaxID=1529436 RepID=UPI0014258502|nr:uncharacterized protein LOC117114917 [Anneissia japonica]
MGQIEMGSFSGRSNSSIDSEITHNIKWVPKSNEEEVESYFMAFEKVANRLKWPAKNWTVLLQTGLIGKAQEVFSSLSDDLCESYETVKRAILEAYELVPVAYRQKFRNLKYVDKSFMEFARKKQVLFDRWCTSEGVNWDFNQLRELILVEEFNNCLSSEVRTHLKKWKFNELMKAATMADNFVLTHKSVNKISHNDDTFRGAKLNTANRNQSGFTTSSGKGFQRPLRDIVCYDCKRKGHVKSDCWLLQKKKGDVKPFPNAFLSVLNTHNDVVDHTVKFKSSDTEMSFRE